MIVIREPDRIYQISGAVQNGTFAGRWHFSLDDYMDPAYLQFGTLRVFNDNTLSPGASWPPHPHREVEILTYCIGGEFRHSDARGGHGILRKGWVQHMTVGQGMSYSQINNRTDEPMRFIQMWFHPSKRHLNPSVEQKPVEKAERTNRFLTLVSPALPGALVIHSDAAVLSCFIEKDRAAEHTISPGRGAYLYVLEGGPVAVNGRRLSALGAAKCFDESDLSVKADTDAELLLVDVLL